MNDKEKLKVFNFSRKNNIKGLRRSYDFYTSLFTALLVSLLFFFFDTIKEITSASLTFNRLIIDVTILVAISLLFIAVANSRDESFFAIKIREENLTNSKKKAFGLMDSYSVKKK